MTEQESSTAKIHIQVHKPIKNYPKLQIIGQELITNFGLIGFRRKFQFDAGIIGNSSDQEIGVFVLGKLSEFGITKKSQDSSVDMEIIHREFAAFSGKDGLCWHIDDCQLVTKTTPPNYSQERFIHLFDDRWLYISGARSRIPRWTMILYLSTEGIGQDFVGGRLRLADGTEYRAEAGLGLLIDSREVHMVTPVRSGKRKSIVIKIY
jgi:hypothetical protein